MKKCHVVKNVAIHDSKLKITVDSVNYEFELSAISEKLTAASDVERQNYQISPSGYGIHWPLIDEDLSIDGLLGIKHSLPNFNKAAHI